MSEDSHIRWRFLIENPAVAKSGFLPPAEAVPELADLGAEHARLLVVQGEAQREASARTVEKYFPASVHEYR